MLPVDSLPHQMFLGFVLAGMGGGAMSSLSFGRRSLPIFVSAAIVPYALTLFWIGGRFQVVMGTMALLFTFALITGARRYNATVVETLRLRYTNETLICDLQQQAKSLASLNARLRTEVERTAEAKEQERRAKLEAERASLAKSQFLANMSHEIRTPMNGVLGMTDVLLRTPLAGRQLEIAQTIRSSGKALLEILNDVLDLSRIEAGRIDLRIAPFDVARMVRDAADLFREQAAEKGVALDVTVDQDCLWTLAGDQVRLRQIVLNLVGNAVKFTEQGRIVVTLESAGERDGLRDVRISVQDSGVGIAPEAMQRVFQPFEQADGSITRRFGGTGLGLSISRQLSELMGGQIALTSTLGKGTTATLALRLAPAAAPAPPPADASQSRPLVGTRVLLAEENPVNRLIAIEYLQEFGCAVDVVECGRSALAAAESTVYNVILMDCQLPELDGLALTKRIRAFEHAHGRRRVPIVALTAQAYPEYRASCLEAGMDEHLAKPYEQDDLATCIVNVLRRAAERQPPALVA